MMTLYYTKRSPYARKVLVTAHEKGVADRITPVEINLADKPQSFLNHNPLGKIPALVTEKGDVYYESPVICEYLDTLSPAPRLYPAAAENRVPLLNRVALADGLMDVTVAYVVEGQRPAHLQSQAHKEKHLATVDRTLTLLTEKLAEFGDTATPATIALACALGYLSFRIPQTEWQTRYPALSAWYDAFSRRDSMRQTIPVVS